MSEFSLNASWLDSDLSSAEERESFAEISIRVGNHLLSRIYEDQSCTVSNGARLPAVWLATGILANWWTLLYEPAKREGDPGFEARHSLDALANGYVFPPIAIWSGGDALTVCILKADTRFHRQQFFFDQRGPWTLSRDDVEPQLRRFVESTIAQLHARSVESTRLREAWDLVSGSLADPGEMAWCINAGRLGLDPYDPDTPDFRQIQGSLSDQLFGDICEAVEPNELSVTGGWITEAINRLPHAPPIPLSGFGKPPRPDLSRQAWREGYDTASLLRRRLGLDKDPSRRAADNILAGAGASDEPRGWFIDSAPASIEGVAQNQKNEIRTTIPARSFRQRRFRLCRSVYLGWRAGSGNDAAATTADTWRQQASRAFAAELLAPAELLKERAGTAGLTQDDVEGLAEELACPVMAIIHQAENHRVRLRGVHSPV